MKKENVATYVAVGLCLLWGSILRFTGQLSVADDLPLLAGIEGVIALLTIVAPFLPWFTFHGETRNTVMISLSVISGIALIIMTVKTEDLVALEILYVGVSAVRILLLPILLGLARDNLGRKRAGVLLIVGYHLGNAVGKPFVSNCFKQSSTLALKVGVAVILLSAVAAWIAHNNRGSEEHNEPVKQQNSERLGRLLFVYLGMQVLYFLRGFLVFPLAEEMLGSINDSGSLELILELTTVVGVGICLTPLVRTGLNLLGWMLFAQFFSSLGLVLSLQFKAPWLLYLSKMLEGASQGFLLYTTQQAYLSELAGYPLADEVFERLELVVHAIPALGRGLACTQDLHKTFIALSVLSFGLFLMVRSKPVMSWLGRQTYNQAQNN